VQQAAIIHSLPIILYLEGENASPRTPHFVGGNFDAVTGFPFHAIEETPTLWADRLHPDDREHALSALDERRQTGSMSIEYRWECADGQYRHFLDQAVLLPAADGDEAQFAGTLIDVSERKQLEAQILQAGKLDAIGQLTGGVAHDFNNLLAAILGGIGLLERRIEFEPREQMIIQQMRHAAENGAELVRRMMAFARKQALRPEHIAPEQICQSVAGLVQHTLGGTVSVDWQCNSRRNFFVDKAQLELALVNLIINARDALPQGGSIGIQIDDLSDDEQSGAKLKPGQYLRIRVIDEGTGIAREMIDRIVEPFFTTKEIGKGTGLGLSMVVGFAQQSGGKVNIRSTQGEGTTIEMILPSTTKDVAAQPAVSVRPAPVVERRRVLLVDDDDGVREVLGELLRELNLDVIAAADGQAALNILQQPEVEVDILLTDFAMPGINGSETILRAREIRPELHSILMTGYADDRIVMRDLGTTPLLRKPIDLAHLQDVISGSSGELESASPTAR
jgi:signal transduction histidine kinase/ActR/RegA family two-component response regulator